MGNPALRQTDASFWVKNADARNTYFKPECRDCGAIAAGGVADEADGPVWTISFFCMTCSGNAGRFAVSVDQAHRWVVVAALGRGHYRMRRIDEATRKKG